jgi:hypothetical protein
MCLTIDDSVTSLNKRIVWKVFDRSFGNGITSLYQGAVYPKGKLVERSPGISNDNGTGTHGLHFYLSKAIARRNAQGWHDSYIAKFAVDPKDFMFANVDGDKAMYQRATRVGSFIKVGFKRAG